MEPLPLRLCAWLETLHITVLKDLKCFAVCLFALLWIYTLYIKSQVTGKVRKTGNNKKNLKPPVAIFHSNIYLAFFSFIPLLLWYLKHREKYYIWKVGRGIDPKVLLLPGEIWPFVCFIFFWTCLGKHKLFYFFFSKCGHDLASREINMCPSVCLHNHKWTHPFSVLHYEMQSLKVIYKLILKKK